MPLPPELRKGLDSTVADIANVPPGGSRDGGMLVAAHFLAHFVPDEASWANIDIAGPSWNGGQPYGHTPKGGTGVIVRTLIQLAENRAGLLGGSGAHRVHGPRVREPIAVVRAEHRVVLVLAVAPSAEHPAAPG